MQRMWVVVALFPAVLLGVVDANPCVAGSYEVDETQLRAVDSDAESPVFSQEGLHLAYVTRKGAKSVVVVDGVSGTGYDEIEKSSLAISLDGKRVAYLARKGEKWVVVVDGVPGPEYDEVPKWTLVYNGDVKHIAYLAKKGDKYVVVVDGQPGAEYDEIDDDSVVFSADGKRLAYAATKEDSEYLTVAGGQSGPVRHAGSPVFSTDGKRLAYVVRHGEKSVVVVDDVTGPEYDGIVDDSIVFSADGKRVAYVASTSDNKCFVVVDGQPGPKCDAGSRPVLSPDGKRLAHRVRHGEMFVVVVDGVTGPEYDMIENDSIVFSADGRRVAYVAQIWKGKEGVRFVSSVVVDGQAGLEFYSASRPVFSPDGKHLAYGATGNVVSAAGTVGGALFVIEQYPLYGNTIVVDGQAGPRYVYGVQLPVFSQDSKHLAYLAKEGEKWVVVIDGRPGPAYERVFTMDPIQIQTDGAVEYLAYRSNVLYRVKHIPVP
ncbi:MAG: hypothetical protein Q7T82_04945 [Armatimonadota bacterium]|nr:hypothetical protein [Armatimonadota bacterium]